MSQSSDQRDALPRRDAIDSIRLDWLLSHQGAQCGRLPNGGCYIQAWVCHSAPGNIGGAGGTFTASGESHRACIDKFLAGDIQRII